MCEQILYATNHAEKGGKSTILNKLQCIIGDIHGQVHVGARPCLRPILKG